MPPRTRNLEIPPPKGKDTGDDWANATAAPAAPEKAEAIKKLSLEFPETVHRSTKAGAAMLGVTMIGVIVQMCRSRFMGEPWPADVVEQVRKQIAAEQQASEPEPEPAPAARRPRKSLTARPSRATRKKAEAEG
jgi:hypothetical protein